MTFNTVERWLSEINKIGSLWIFLDNRSGKEMKICTVQNRIYILLILLFMNIRMITLNTKIYRILLYRKTIRLNFFLIYFIKQSLILLCVFFFCFKASKSLAFIRTIIDIKLVSDWPSNHVIVVSNASNVWLQVEIVSVSVSSSSCFSADVFNLTNSIIPCFYLSTRVSAYIFIIYPFVNIILIGTEALNLQVYHLSQ